MITLIILSFRLKQYLHVQNHGVGCCECQDVAVQLSRCSLLLFNMFQFLCGFGGCNKCIQYNVNLKSLKLFIYLLLFIFFRPTTVIRLAPAYTNLGSCSGLFDSYFSFLELLFTCFITPQLCLNRLSFKYTSMNLLSQNIYIYIFYKPQRGIEVNILLNFIVTYFFIALLCAHCGAHLTVTYCLAY